MRSVSMKTPLMVRFATSTNKDNSDKQRMLASEESQPRSASPLSSRHEWTAPESFANPMYDNNPYAPTTMVDDVFDTAVSVGDRAFCSSTLPLQVHPSPPKNDNDSGLGSASVLLNV
jgi:hypothetical protein